MRSVWYVCHKHTIICTMLLYGYLQDAVAVKKFMNCQLFSYQTPMFAFNIVAVCTSALHDQCSCATYATYRFGLLLHAILVIIYICITSLKRLYIVSAYCAVMDTTSFRPIDRVYISEHFVNGINKISF